MNLPIYFSVGKIIIFNMNIIITINVGTDDNEQYYKMGYLLKNEVTLR